MYEKRKNGTRRRLPWWGVMLVVGFALGVVVTLLLTRPLQVTGQNEVVLPLVTVSDPILLTATVVIQEATARAGFEETLVFQQAQPTPDAWVDPLALTATHVVRQATATAQAAGS